MHLSPVFRLYPYEEQITRWRREPLTTAQLQEVDRAADNLAQERKLVEMILALAAELKEGTINRIMEKSDEEVGLAFLTGALKL